MLIGTVARELGVSPSFLRKLEKDGAIPDAHRRLSGRRDYEMADIEVIERCIEKRNPQK